MKRILPILVLIGFLVYTGVFVFVYLFRAFRLGEPVPGEVVRVWHGDAFLRAILIAVFFQIGLSVLMYVGLTRAAWKHGGGLRLRPDLWEWLRERSDETGEPVDEIAERAVAVYRARLEGVRM